MAMVEELVMLRVQAEVIVRLRVVLVVTRFTIMNVKNVVMERLIIRPVLIAERVSITPVVLVKVIYVLLNQLPLVLSIRDLQL